MSGHGTASLRKLESVTISLNHTIVFAKDKQESASFLTRLFGLPDAVPAGPFLAVQLDHGVTLDYADMAIEILPQHYAFLVSEEDFDAIYGRILADGMEHWPDPFKSVEGTYNTNDGGRGVYFNDPNGHNLEIITRPYGGW